MFVMQGLNEESEITGSAEKRSTSPVLVNVMKSLTVRRWKTVWDARSEALSGAKVVVTHYAVFVELFQGSFAV